MEEINLTGKERRVAKLLLRYMKSHPEAKHTAEGIARWWILEQKLEEEINVIQKVLDYLTENGVLEKVSLPMGDSYYKINSEKIEMLLNHQINR